MSGGLPAETDKTAAATINVAASLPGMVKV
jgi:hypothetical protein